MSNITHLLSLSDITSEGFEELLKNSAKVKKTSSDSDVLSGKSLALLFEKPSTRTRVSFEVGIYELDGTPITLNASEIQLSRGEPVRDTARVLSRYADAVIARVHDHESLEECVQFGTIPVINALSDRFHPCQAIADFFTIREKKDTAENLKIAYLGDGNNVCHSLIFGAAHTGSTLHVATPTEYQPETEVWTETREIGRSKGAEITGTTDPDVAATNADVLYTDVWTSMGQEEEARERKRLFQDFQINEKLLRKANSDAIVMHCLPAHRGEEITDQVLEGPQSVVWTQAENRLHTQKALLASIYSDPS